MTTHNRTLTLLDTDNVTFFSRKHWNIIMDCLDLQIKTL